MSPHRVNIINTLQLLASVDAQLQYHIKAPVNVANELVNQWFDDFYHPDSSEFKADFTSSELKILAEFHKFYDDRVLLLPDTLPNMLLSEAWSEVVAEAEIVLKTCGWKDLEVNYES